MVSTSISSETETVNGRSFVASLYLVMHKGLTFRYRRRQSRHKSEWQSWRALGRKTGGGSRKGIPNKATKDIRAVFSAFVEHNAEHVQVLFDQVAEKDPAKALDLLAKMSEFVVPRLSRSTVDGDLGIRGKLIID